MVIDIKSNNIITLSFLIIRKVKGDISTPLLIYFFDFFNQPKISWNNPLAFTLGINDNASLIPSAAPNNTTEFSVMNCNIIVYL